MQEIERLIQDYEKEKMLSKYSENSLYNYKSNRKLKQELQSDYDEIVSLLKYIKNTISRSPEMLVVYNKSNTWTKYYYKSPKWHRLLSKNTKNIKLNSLILNMQALNYKGLFFELIKNIDKIFNKK